MKFLMIMLDWLGAAGFAYIATVIATKGGTPLTTFEVSALMLLYVIAMRSRNEKED
jgi:hypothetical protein